MSCVVLLRYVVVVDIVFMRVVVVCCLFVFVCSVVSPSCAVIRIDYVCAIFFLMFACFVLLLFFILLALRVWIFPHPIKPNCFIFRNPILFVCLVFVLSGILLNPAIRIFKIVSILFHLRPCFCLLCCLLWCYLRQKKPTFLAWAFYFVFVLLKY